jgi:hypothetical protein
MCTTTCIVQNTDSRKIVENIANDCTNTDEEPERAIGLILNKVQKKKYSAL